MILLNHIVICQLKQLKIWQSATINAMEKMKNLNYQKGRGAQLNVHNKFELLEYLKEDNFLEHLRLNDEDTSGKSKTRYIHVYPKSIVNKVDSPDVGMALSMNPYQGCEHGCTYCYARNTHEFWGFSAGTDFEKYILVKPDAPKLLEAAFQKKSWKPLPIMLSGNTDCYQPAEKKYQLTRQILELCLKYKQPVGVITKNVLVTRDLDILSEMAKYDIINVSLSINSVNENLRRLMEPRTASSTQRINTVKRLTDKGIPVNVMVAPIVPGLNSHEIMKVTKAVSEAGASSIGYTVVRLNGQISKIFMHWLAQAFPDKAEKVQHQIEACHNGKLNDSEFGRRMRGSGQEAEQISQLIKLARRKYFKGKEMPELNSKLFLRAPKGQLGLF